MFSVKQSMANFIGGILFPHAQKIDAIKALMSVAVPHLHNIAPKGRRGFSPHIQADRAAPKPRSEFQQIVHKMSNYERNKWARAGYPGLMHEDMRKLNTFISLWCPLLAIRGRGRLNKFTWAELRA